ncbi:retrovirus-related pol polyprotein from transposon TNT 1-94, partial [Tanacetum coccineum]
MAAVEVPQTFEYKGGQLNAAPVLEVENFTNCKKRFMCLIIDDQMNSIINCLTAKSTWDDMILYHEGPSDVKESRVMDLKLKGNQRFSSAKANNQTECHKYGKKGHFARDCWSKTSVPSYQSPFQPKLLHSSEHKPKIRHTKDFESKYSKVKAKLALLSSSVSAPSASLAKKGLLFETYDWDEDEVSSDDNEVTEVKALITLTDEERVLVSKESARNGEWIKISMKKVHTPLEMEDNDDRKSFLDYLCIDLNYVEEQRNNRMSKHRNLVQELNTCKEQLLVLKQAKLDLLTMQHVNTKILKENQNLRNELKELTSITKAWLNSFNKVNQTKDPVFVKSSADNSEVSITDSNKPKLSRAEDSILSNHDTGKYVAPLPPLEKLTNVEPVFEPKTIKSILNILKSKSTFKIKTLKGITINEPSSTPSRGNKSSSASKTNSALADINQNYTGQSESSLKSRPSRPAIPFTSCIHYGYNDHQSNDYVYYPICKIYGSYDHDTYGHNRIISLRSRIKPRNPQNIIKNYETCGSNVHTTSDHNDIEWFRKREALQAKKVESFKASKTESSSALRSSGFLNKTNHPDPNFMQCNIRESLSRLNH